MKRKFQEIAEDLSQKIAFLNRLVFNNHGAPIHIISYDNNDWKDVKGITAYNAEKDFFIVLTKNIYKLSDVSEAGLFGLAAHEVRHKFQHKNHNCILSQNFLIKRGIIKKDIIDELKIFNKKESAQYLEHELDAMIVEELVRNICVDLSFNEILDKKINQIVSLITCNEKNLNIFYQESI